jgi:uncharacterized protein YndB with AHSA1/START domain
MPTPSNSTRTNAAAQVFEIYIKASAQKIWDAITQPEWTKKYGYKAAAEYDLRAGGIFCEHASPEMRAMGLEDVIIDGEVIEADPPRKLVHTFRFLFTPEQKAEGFTRITWEIETTTPGFCRLTITHDTAGAPGMASMVAGKYSDRGGGGWTWILSDLKSLLETGAPMAA